MAKSSKMASPDAVSRKTSPKKPGPEADETLESLKIWWYENGKYLVASAVIGLAAVGGWKAWEYNQQMTMREASGLYAELIDYIENEEPAAEPSESAENENSTAVSSRPGAGEEHVAERLFNRLSDDFRDTPYPVLAALAMARFRVTDGDVPAAAEHLRWAAEHTEQEGIKALALVRLTRVLLEMGRIEEASDILIDYDFPRGLEAIAEEINGDILRAQKRNREAIAAYRNALSRLPDQQGFIEMKLQILGASPVDDASPEADTEPAAELPEDTGAPDIIQ